MKTKLLFLIAGGITSGLTMLLLTAVTPSWESWQAATCLPHCFCEADRVNQSIRQPINAWSSLAFILSGACIFASAWTRKEIGRLTRNYSAVLAVSAVVIGIGSAFFHASLSLVGQFFDVFGMYLLTTFMLLYAWERLFQWTSISFGAAYIILNIALSSLLLYVPETRRFVFALILIVALVFENLVRRYKKPSVRVGWWYAGLSLFAVAYIIWVLDNTKILCVPDSLLQGHAVWHVAGAIAVLLLYRYYASEVIRQSTRLP